MAKTAAQIITIGVSLFAATVKQPPDPNVKRILDTLDDGEGEGGDTPEKDAVKSEVFIGEVKAGPMATGSDQELIRPTFELFEAEDGTPVCIDNRTNKQVPLDFCSSATLVA